MILIINLLFHLLALIGVLLSGYCYIRLKDLENKIIEENAKATFAKEVLLDLDSKLSQKEIESRIDEFLIKGENSDMSSEELNNFIKAIIEKRKNTIKGLNNKK